MIKLINIITGKQIPYGFHIDFPEVLENKICTGKLNVDGTTVAFSDLPELEALSIYATYDYYILVPSVPMVIDNRKWRVDSMELKINHGDKTATYGPKLILLDHVTDLWILLDDAISAIDALILDTIGKYDYDSVEQLGVWIRSKEYSEEASALLDWSLACQTIAYKIKKGEIKILTPDNAINMLPPEPLK
jgi:hypothetical protein